MSATLWIGPAASGKTQVCVERVRELTRSAPLTPTWALLPDGHQTAAFRRRLLATGGAFGVHVGTFDDLYIEVLALTDRPLAIAPEPVLHRLIQSVLDQLADEGRLRHYGAIRRRPGLTLALNDLFAELKRSRVDPARLADVVAESGPRLIELATAYARYQDALIRTDWADAEGRGWLAIEALQRHAALCVGWHVVVDGFDSFTATQREMLKFLDARCGSLALTLMGEGDLSRSAYRRFRTTRDALVAEGLALTTRTLPPRRSRPAPLRRLSDWLFVPPVDVGASSEPAPTPAPQTAVYFLEAQSQALEAREALRWLKARHLRDDVGLSGCAVIARDLTPYAPYLTEAAREFGLPLTIAAGAALEANPAVAAFLIAIGLPVNDWARRPVLDLVRSPYVDLSGFGLARRDAARLDAASRAGQVIFGLAQWHEAFDILSEEPGDAMDAAELDAEDTPPSLPRGDAARALGDGLLALLTRLTPPPTASLRDYVVWAEDLIDALRIETALLQHAETRPRDHAAFESLRAIFAALILSDDVFGRTRTLTFAEFYAELRGAVAAARYRVEIRQSDAITAMDLRLARGVPYDAVAVLGLAEGLFPAPLSEDPFLSDEERAGLQEQGLRLEPRLRSDQQSLFYEAVTRAERFLLLTRPYLADDGEAWQPSPFWQAARELFDAAVARVRQGDPRPWVDAASGVEALEAAPPFDSAFAEQLSLLRHQQTVLTARLAGDAGSPYDGDLRQLAARFGDRFGPVHTWSPSRLETYGACGYQFFVTSALGLEPRDPPRLGLDAAQIGTLLHAILERVYTAAGTTEVEAVVAALPDVAAPLFASAPRDLGFRPTSLWARQQTELLAWLEGSLRGLDAAADGFTPIAFEQRFARLKLDTPKGAVRVRGVIDRVDRNAAGEIRVIDYKTGSSHLDPQALLDGTRLQLPLYAAAAQDLALGEPVDGLYWALRRGEAGRLRLAEFAFTDDAGRSQGGVVGAVALAAAHIARSVTGIRSGRFVPEPPRDGCPAYCPAAAFCWRYRPER